MSQYNQIKSRHPEALLLFRVGDFYETFGEDAVKMSRALGIVLTRRANGSATHVELAGFPYHSMDTYLPRLVKAGFRVAICDQLEDPKTTKTLVKRGITEMVSPGVTVMNGILEENSSNYLASLFYHNDEIGAVFLDISTGEFKMAQDESENILRLISSLNPSEILYPRSQMAHFEKTGLSFKRISALEDWNFDLGHSEEMLYHQFSVSSLEGLGIQKWSLGIRAAGACLQYLKESRHGDLPHLVRIEKVEQNQFLYMDRFTQRNLELIHTQHEDSKTLFDVLQGTRTPMGARLLKSWLIMPLKEIKPIQERLDLVQFFLNLEAWTEELKNQLEKIGDLERLVSRLALLKAGPREIWILHRALMGLEAIQKLWDDPRLDTLLHHEKAVLNSIRFRFIPLESLSQSIVRTLHPDPPAVLVKGNVIAQGYNPELDELRELAFGGKDYLITLQNREQARTGISSLKISFNSVFGYYFEVTHVHKDKIPTDWIRKQTLVNAERYISSELKVYEEKILGAEEKIAFLEASLYRSFLEKILAYIVPLQNNAAWASYLDVLTHFSSIARGKNYHRPQINEGYGLKIIEGRHPVIEECLPKGDKYIPNDLILDPESQQILMITGPNMAGKSAILRQTALIVIMAQIGSFVPAEKVEMGLVDKLFTRVGASDNLSSGQSTFMVEMIETASILNNLSPRSLILLDEIGRGTSTYDGISIAWSIAEYLHNETKFPPKTLFATHYHELNEMEGLFPRIHNFSIAVKDTGDRVIFLRKLVSGGSEHSFGIQVAKMAGIPTKIVLRAQALLLGLEKGNSPWAHGKTVYPEGRPVALDRKTQNPKLESTLDIYPIKVAEPDPNYLNGIQKRLLELDLNHITPMEAMMLLSEWKKTVLGKK